MGPEIWIALVAVFVSGGAVGTAGTLLSQWLVRRFDGASADSSDRDGAGLDALRGEMSDMARQLRNLDARLDFTERLLDGALAPDPAMVAGPEPAGSDTGSGEPRSAS
ncbi:MAG: hypothetical protein AB7T31_02810 [Gemmatimonadales bacterium]